MLNEAKRAMRVTVSAFDQEIMDLCKAGAMDLRIAGVVVPGNISYTIGTGGAVTDTSSLKDPLVQRAIITYAATHFGNPPNHEQLSSSYETQKEQLMHAADYTDYGGESE